jgi:hypothetical protein
MTALMRTTGREVRLAVLPGTGLDLAVTAEHVYVVAGASQNVAWRVPCRGIARVQPLRVGRGAVGVLHVS